MDDLITALDNLLALRDKATASAIDAGACNTRRDHERARTRADALDEARDAFIADMHAAVVVARRTAAGEIVALGERLTATTAALVAIVHAPNLDVAIDAIKTARDLVPPPATGATWAPGSRKGGES